MKQIYAKNKKELARLIGISHPALLRLFERDDHPEAVLGKGWLIDQWQRYAKANIHYWKQRNGNGKSPSTANLRDEAYIKRQEIAAEREAFNLDVERGKYWPKDTAMSLITRYAATLWRELDKVLVHELPARDEGLTAGEISKVHKQRMRTIRGNVDKILQAA